MPSAPSFDDVYETGKAEMLSRRADLAINEGDVTDVFLNAGAAMVDLALRFDAQAFKETFLDGAVGDALTALVDDHFGLQREAATSAQVSCAFTRPFDAGAEPAGTIALGHVVATEFDANGDEVQFTLDANLVFGLGVLTLSGACTASVAGRAGNVLANKVTRNLDTIAFDSTFTVNNAALAAGGNLKEPHEELRARARAFYGTLRRGTVAALEYGALQVASVRVATVSENASTGIATVTVTDSDGNSTAQMVSDVVTNLELWRAAGSVVVVVGGSVLSQAITVTVDDVRDGFSVAAHVTLITAAITARMAKLGANETLFLDAIIAAIIAIAPDDIFNVTFTVPTIDVVPTAGQVIRAGAISVS